MKIDTIFADKLFAFHYENEEDNEYNRNIELWTNPSYLSEFYNIHVTEKTDKAKYIKERIEDAEQIIDKIEEISKSTNNSLDNFFEVLNESENYIFKLRLQKGKTKHVTRRNDLRFYAIRIDEDCFAITGGAIKVTQKMQENELTCEELRKLEKCRNYLRKKDVFDCDSFFELLCEDYDK